MRVSVLLIAVYQDRWKHATEEIAHPSWRRIKSSIIALDQFHRPFVNLQLTSSPECEYLTVFGGNGVYTLSGAHEHYSLRTYYDPAHGSHEIPVWTSDQGLQQKEQNVCYDLERVLRVAKYWAEQGDFDPSVQWAEG